MDTITIDGRQFHGVTQELSAAQDHYLVGQLRLAGALEALTQKEKPEEATEMMLTQILVSGRAPFVLAGCLTEEGKPWTFAEAGANAAAFASVTNAAEKKAMMDSLVSFVLGFFQFAIASVATSRKSSSPN